MTANLFLERTFDEPLTPEDVREGGRESAWCLDLHRVRWQGSFLALDGRTMICTFSAPDMESARLRYAIPTRICRGSGPAPCTRDERRDAERRRRAVVRGACSVRGHQGTRRRQSLVPRDLQRDVFAHVLLARRQAHAVLLLSTRHRGRAQRPTRGRRSRQRHLGRLIGRTRAAIAHLSTLARQKFHARSHGQSNGRGSSSHRTRPPAGPTTEDEGQRK